MNTVQTDPRDAFFDVSALKAGMESRAGRASILVLAMAGLKLVLHLGSTIVLARLIPPEEFGIASLAMPIAVIAMNLSQFGLAQPIVQMPTVTHRLVSTLFWVNLLLGALFGGALVAGSGAAARFYGVPEVGPVFAVLGLSVVMTAILTQYIAILRRKMHIRLLEYGALAAFALSVAAAVVAAFLGASYWAVILQQVLQGVLTVAIFAFHTPWLPSRPRLRDLREARSALSFGGNVALSNLLEQASHALPVILIGRLYSPLEAGLYQRSSTLARLLPTRAVSPLASVFVSSLSRVQDDPAAFRSLFLRMMTRLNMIMMPIGVLAFTCADIVVPVVLGQDWAASAPILAWLCLMLLQNTLDQGVNWALIASGASRSLTAISALSLVIVCVAMYAIGNGGDIVLIAMVLMLSNTFVRQPVLAWLGITHTHLDLETVIRGYLLDLGLAVVAIVLVTAVRGSIVGGGDFVELAASIAIVVLLFAARVMANAELRADVLKLVFITAARR
ncbi:oligosaccharide flippase family protein [Meridianimarinicoccus roseus]|nr:oligosaccharide flippase family protein [Meridianimarinicoccus roseus]